MQRKWYVWKSEAKKDNTTYSQEDYFNTKAWLYKVS